MIDDLLRKIEEAIKGFFADGMIDALGKLTGDINKTVESIGTEVAKSPEAWNGDVFDFIKDLSDTVILPLAGILITYVLVYELYQMVVDKNNFKSFEISDMMKYIFKASISVLLLSHTFDIAMAIFDVGGHIVGEAVIAVKDNTDIILADPTAMRAELMSMPLYEVAGMWAETLLISTMMTVISVVIMVLLYGRMLEVYLYISVAPLPFAAFGNKDLSSASQNYVRGLVSVAFQGFFIMVCVGIYAKLVISLAGSSGDLHETLMNVAISTIVLLFVLLKSSSISKSIFGAH